MSQAMIYNQFRLILTEIRAETIEGEISETEADRQFDIRCAALKNEYDPRLVRRLFWKFKFDLLILDFLRFVDRYDPYKPAGEKAVLLILGQDIENRISRLCCALAT